jgi:hypothetical protein
MRSLLLLCALAACSDDGSPAPIDGPPQIDAAPGDMMGNGLATTCTGACATTSLTAMFGSTTRQLDVAYFGISGGATLYVEAYGGAAAGCPTMNSPTPDYTLIFGNVPMPTSTAMVTSPANLIDFQGDLLTSPAPMAATSVMLTPVAKNPNELALDVNLTFPAGTIAGHLFATHCDSLDD